MEALLWDLKFSECGFTSKKKKIFSTKNWYKEHWIKNEVVNKSKRKTNIKEGIFHRAADKIAFVFKKLWPETDVAVEIVRKFQFYNDIIVVFTNWLLNFCFIK